MVFVEVTRKPSFIALSYVRLCRWARFFIGGSLNTAITYLFYLGLNKLFNYQISFLIAYALGIGFSYLFNTKIVFRANISLRGCMTYPLVYVVQYVVSAMALGFFVESLGLSKVAAPILVAIITLPITYLLSKRVILRR